MKASSAESVGESASDRTRVVEQTIGIWNPGTQEKKSSLWVASHAGAVSCNLAAAGIAHGFCRGA